MEKFNLVQATDWGLSDAQLPHQTGQGQGRGLTGWGRPRSWKPRPTTAPTRLSPPQPPTSMVVPAWPGPGLEPAPGLGAGPRPGPRPGPEPQLEPQLETQPGPQPQGQSWGRIPALCLVPSSLGWEGRWRAEEFHIGHHLAYGKPIIDLVEGELAQHVRSRA